ncbi:MAG: hypothetical protein ACJ76H_02400 [Bacteriovoracaceae bacterium]
MLALSRKLCPFFSFMLLMGCGKKMTEPNTTAKPHIENQKPSPTLIIPIEEASFEYKIPQSGDFLLPDRLRVRSGNADGKVVSITYNIHPDDPETYEFKCVYKGVSADSMPVAKCVNIEGQDLGNVTDGTVQFALEADNSIKFESNSEELKADAIYDVDWK